MSGTVCCYLGCKKSYSTDKDITFFKFPDDSKRRKKWMQNSGNLELETLSERQLRGKRICSDHFIGKSFVTDSKRALTDDAVPIVAKATPSKASTPTPAAKTEKVKEKVDKSSDGSKVTAVKTSVVSTPTEITPRTSGRRRTATRIASPEPDTKKEAPEKSTPKTRTSLKQSTRNKSSPDEDAEEDDKGNDKTPKATPKSKELKRKSVASPKDDDETASSMMAAVGKAIVTGKKQQQKVPSSESVSPNTSSQEGATNAKLRRGKPDDKTPKKSKDKAVASNADNEEVDEQLEQPMENLSARRLRGKRRATESVVSQPVKEATTKDKSPAKEVIPAKSPDKVASTKDAKAKSPVTQPKLKSPVMEVTSKVKTRASVPTLVSVTASPSKDKKVTLKKSGTDEQTTENKESGSKDSSLAVSPAKRLKQSKDKPEPVNVDEPGQVKSFIITCTNDSVTTSSIPDIRDIIFAKGSPAQKTKPPTTKVQTIEIVVKPDKIMKSVESSDKPESTTPKSKNAAQSKINHASIAASIAKAGIAVMAKKKDSDTPEPLPAKKRKLEFSKPGMAPNNDHTAKIIADQVSKMQSVLLPTNSKQKPTSGTPKLGLSMPMLQKVDAGQSDNVSESDSYDEYMYFDREFEEIDRYEDEADARADREFERFYATLRKFLRLSGRWSMGGVQWDPQGRRKVIIISEPEIGPNGRPTVKRCLQFFEDKAIRVFIDGLDMTDVFGMTCYAEKEDVASLVCRVAEASSCCGVPEMVADDFVHFPTAKQRNTSYFDENCPGIIPNDSIEPICEPCKSLQQEVHECREKERERLLERRKRSQGKQFQHPFGEALYTMFSELVDETDPTKPKKKRSKETFFRKYLHDTRFKMEGDSPKTERVYIEKPISVDSVSASFQDIVSKLGFNAPNMKKGKPPSVPSTSRPSLPTPKPSRSYPSSSHSGFRKTSLALDHLLPFSAGSSFTLDDGQEYELIGEVDPATVGSEIVEMKHNPQQFEIIEVDDETLAKLASSKNQVVVLPEAAAFAPPQVTRIDANDPNLSQILKAINTSHGYRLN